MSKKNNVVSLVELQGILSEVMLAVLDESQTEEERAASMATASNVYAGARNMIHNASTIMRAKEIIAEGKIKDISSITTIVGE